MKMFQSDAKRVMSVLILDDDIFQAKTLQMNLKRNGFRVTDTVYSGIEAINSVKREIPDIALLDIRLDGQKIDGIDVGKKINEIDTNIIVIYITAFDTDENFSKALSSSPHAFIEKPYKMRTLCQEIELAVNQAVSKDYTKPPLRNENDSGQEPYKKPKVLCFPDFLLINEGENGYSRVPISDILFLEADNVWTDVHTKDGEIRLTASLGNFAKELDYLEILRVHRSYIINLKQVVRVNVKANGGYVVINDEKIPVSRANVSAFWEAWNRLFGSNEEE